MNASDRGSGPLPGMLAPVSYLLARAYRLGWMLDVRRQLAGGAARLSKPVLSELSVGKIIGSTAISERKLGWRMRSGVP